LKRFMILFILILSLFLINFLGIKIFSGKLTVYPIFGNTVLSKSEISYIKSITEKTEIIAFIEKDNVTRKIIERNFSILAGYNSNITADIIRLDLNPGFAKKYEIYRANTILIISEDREIRIDSPQIKMIVNGIVRCHSEQATVIFAAAGHNEPSLRKERQPFLKFLERNEYSILQDNLSDEIFKYPIILFPGLGSDITREELELLNEYIERGGNLIFLLEPPTRADLDLGDYYIGLNILLESLNLRISLGQEPVEYEVNAFVNKNNLFRTEINSVTLYSPVITEENRYIMRNIKTTNLLTLRGKARERHTVAIYSEKKLNPGGSKDLNSGVIIIGDSEFLKDRVQNINSWHYLLDLIRFLDKDGRDLPVSEVKGIIPCVKTAKRFYWLVFTLPFSVLLITIKRKILFIP